MINKKTWLVDDVTMEVMGDRPLRNLSTQAATSRQQLSSEKSCWSEFPLDLLNLLFLSLLEK